MFYYRNPQYAEKNAIYVVEKNSGWTRLQNYKIQIQK